MLLVQALIPGARLSIGGMLAGLGGIGLALSLKNRLGGVTVALVVLQLAGGLAPFDLAPRPVQGLHWLPFDAMLSGPMLGNAQALARDAWLWGCALWFAAQAGWRLETSTAAFTGLALALEILQCWMPSQTPDLTPPLIVLGLGLGLSAFQCGIGSSGPNPTGSTSRPS